LSVHEVTLLLLGIPVSVLGIGLRRAMGVRGQVLLIGAAIAAGLYGALVQQLLGTLGAEPGLRAATLRETVRDFSPAMAGGVLIGGLGAVLLRFRGRGAGERQ